MGVVGSWNGIFAKIVDILRSAAGTAVPAVLVEIIGRSQQQL
jgi:hypothetical protein